MSNRQKVSGFGYDAEHAAEVIFRLDLAIATAASRRPSLQQQLQTQRATLVGQEPALPVAAIAETPTEPTALSAAPESPKLPPADWYQDYTDPTLQRYWDGAAWTEHTAPR